MIAIALAGEPDLLIADEPTTALDVTLQAQIITLLKDLQRKRGMGLIFITHDLGVVYRIANRVIVLYQGEVVEAREADSFFQHPEHPYTQKLFAALPNADTRPERIQTNAQPLLKVNCLKVYYPIRKGLFKRTVGQVKAVDDISLTIKTGSTLALVGESGSGKTTIGMAILRLAHISDGQILFAGNDLARLNAHQLKQIRPLIQIVFQDPYSAMNPRMQVAQIVGEGLRKMRAPARERQIDALLDAVGLDPSIKYRYPHEFSGGQRQRICIARALATEPELIICDEPTSALDISAQMQVLQLLLRLQAEKGLSYLLITHNIAVVSYMADDIAVLYRGKIVEAGPTKMVIAEPKHPYTQTLLAAVPSIPKPVDIAT
jgi:peptide/nickel transport system ATP-binding protein